MEKKGKVFCNYIDFLQDDRFIEWRFLQTDELNRYWACFIEEHPECREELDKAIDRFKAVKLNEYTFPGDIKDKLYQRIIQSSRLKNSVRRRIIYHWSAAACITVLVVAGFLFMTQNTAPTEIQQFATITDAIVGQPLPSSEIKLVTEGKVMELGQNAQITLSEDGHATFNGEAIEAKEMVLTHGVMNKLIVPPGKRSTLQLADGTKVWLNSGTELEFPASFKGNTRNIYMKGEIYIEVAKIENQPFYVHTTQFDIQVRGTKFNVSSYSGEQSVVLVEGKVEVAIPDHLPAVLAPNDMLTIDSDKMNMHRVNVSEYTGWKDGVLIFNQASVADILKKIGRYYNVDFEDKSNDRLSAKTCTGKLFLAEELDVVMTSLSVLSSTSFYRENGIIYIK